ncbi:MAG: hypothetical protein IKW64_07390 [Clostridia bacterium]|nr:hypothetical protein [Clostridia bacterium]
MKCVKCGVDIYEGVKKCPYCKTLTGAEEDGKFKDFDFKYTISLSDQKKLENTARESSKGTGADKQGLTKKKKPMFAFPEIRRKSVAENNHEPEVKTVAETKIDASARAREMAKSASQRAAEFIPEGMARYTVRGVDGQEVQQNEPEESLSAYTRVRSTPEPIKEKRSHRTRRTRRSVDKKAILALCGAVVCVFAIVLGISAISSAVSKNSSVVMPYTYVKDNAMYMIYKNKTVKLSDAVITDSYLRGVEENDFAVSAERAAKDAGIVKTAKDGKRTYFFESFDPETGSGVLKYVDKGKAKKIKEVSQAVHNSIVLSADGEELLYLATTDKNGDMGVLYYWNDKMDEPFEIATDIDHGTFKFSGNEEYAIFLQNLNRVQMQGDLYIKSLKKLKDEKVKADSNVCRLFGTNPGGKAFIYGKDYDTSDKSFDIYAMNKKGRSIRLGERTTKEPLMQKTKDKLFVYGIADDGTNNLYTVEIESGKKEKIASGVNEILMLSKDEKTVIYDKVYTGKLADYYAYTKGKQPVKVAGNVVVDFAAVGGKPQMAATADCSKILYISEFESYKGGGTLNLSEYKNGRLVSQQQIAEDVYSVFRAADGGFIVNKDFSPSRKVFDTYLLKKGELTKIKEEIYPEMFGVSKTGDNIFCITAFGVEGKYGNLEKVSLKGETEELSAQVFGFGLNGEDILFYKNLNAEDGSFDLFLKRDGKKVLEADSAVDEILN